MGFRTCYVAFPTAGSPSFTVAGALRVPQIEAGEVPAGGAPAVLICHGSDGVDGRGASYAEALNAAGVATLEIDMWSARGVVRGADARPSSVPETLADAFAGAEFLSRQPEVDPRRIAVMGFSWGGVVAMLTATRRYASALSPSGRVFGAHAAFYPVLWSYNRAPGYEFRDLTGAPVLIQAGSEDAYDTPRARDSFLGALDAETRALVRLVTHEGATHAFDRPHPPKVVTDPYAHDGAGGAVRFEYNPAAAAQARREVVGFFSDVFGTAAD